MGFKPGVKIKELGQWMRVRLRCCLQFCATFTVGVIEILASFEVFFFSAVGLFRISEMTQSPNLTVVCKFTHIS